MPLLRVSIAGAPDSTRSAAIASALTRLTEMHLGKDPALTAVAIQYVDPDHWFIGGQALSSEKTGSFSLHITVTEGTNTKPQVADYIEAVFAAMGELIGGLRDESYIIVEEQPAPAWGYAGRTQEFRFIAGQFKSAA